MGRGDVAAVANRVARALARDANREPLICSRFSRAALRDALESARDVAWVADGAQDLCGHLVGTVLEDRGGAKRAWVGPDGVSFDDPQTLDQLYRVARVRWNAMGAHEHLAWVFRDDLAPWVSLGFSRVHVRAARAIDASAPSWPRSYCVRPGTLGDLEVALALDALVEDGTSAPSTHEMNDEGCRREEWRELLSEPDVRHFVVERAGDPVAQIVSYPLGSLRGSFARTVHFSALAVEPSHRRRGVARALVETATASAHRDGFRYAEVAWRSANDGAQALWTTLGFRATYVRLQRHGDSS